MLYSSGTAIPSTVTLAAHTVGNHVLRHQLLEVSRGQETMIELADHYDEETSYSVDKLTSKLEPLAIIIIMIPIALLVGGVSKRS